MNKFKTTVAVGAMLAGAATNAFADTNQVTIQPDASYCESLQELIDGYAEFKEFAENPETMNSLTIQESQRFTMVAATTAAYLLLGAAEGTKRGCTPNLKGLRIN